MALLAIDTCFGACSAAVAVDGRVAASAYEERRTGHAEAILPMIERVLAEAGIAPCALQRIAVTRGPGTFAGMRIGLAAAHGLRLATGAALIPVSSLWAIGQRVIAERGSLATALAVAVDAGRGQVYLELLDGDGKSPEEPQILTVEEATQRIVRAGAAVAGSGGRLVAAPVAGTFGGTIEPLASAFALAALGLPVAAKPIAPLYFRPADAVVQASPAGLR